jgi:hypothetical protein
MQIPPFWCLYFSIATLSIASFPRLDSYGFEPLVKLYQLIVALNREGDEMEGASYIDALCW